MTGGMQGAHRIQEVAGQLFLHELRVIRDFSVRQDLRSGSPVLTVAMVMETEDRSPNVRVKMAFSHVSSLRVEIAGGEARIIGFDVRDISDRQWESARWEVLDFEDEVLRFYCRDAQVDGVELLSVVQS